MRIDSSNIEFYFRRYKDNLFAIGFNYFKNPADADDVVQETFLKLMRSGKDFDDEAHLRNWLIKVSINECKRVSLSTWMKRKVSLEEYKDSLMFETPEESELFIEVMRLPQKYRQVIHLFYYEDYSVKDIAELLEISPTAVTTRLARGRQKLKGKLLEVWKDE